jgi:ribose transport system ATP-binding protein
MAVSAQISFASLSRFSRYGFIRRRVERNHAAAIGDRLRLRTSSYSAPVESLSGGNQQKTIVGRALAAKSDLWLLEDPTAAIDVKARADLHDIIREFGAGGGGVLIASSDASELLPVCDRVLVMVEGRVVDEVTTQEMTESTLIRRQYGIAPDEPRKEHP